MIWLLSDCFAGVGSEHLQLAGLNPGHRLFNVFVPLVDLAEGGDGTQIWPGSHLDRTRAAAYHEARSGRLAGDTRDGCNVDSCRLVRSRYM